jgi:hypothetical protein
VPAFNVNNLEQIQAIMEAADEAHSPVILQASAAVVCAEEAPRKKPDPQACLLALEALQLRRGPVHCGLVHLTKFRQRLQEVTSPQEIHHGWS